MLKYLSDDWMDAAGAALAADRDLAEASADLDLGIDFEVTSTPLGKRRYGLRFRQGDVSLVNPPEGDAQVNFSADYETATAIATGELPIQVAFMQGRLKLGGDVAVLVRSGAALDRVGDTLASLRDQTEF